jgi:hypothetical protein
MDRWLLADSIVLLSEVKPGCREIIAAAVDRKVPSSGKALKPTWPIQTA